MPLHGPADAVLVVQLAELAKCRFLPTFHFALLTNWNTATSKPWFQARSAMPKAAVDLPLPGPVWTASTGALRRARVVRPSTGTVSGWPCGIEVSFRPESSGPAGGVRCDQPRQAIRAKLREPHRGRTELSCQHIGQSQSHIGRFAVHYDGGRTFGH